MYGMFKHMEISSQQMIQIVDVVEKGILKKGTGWVITCERI